MADIPNRDELERKLARELGKLNQAQMARLLEQLGDPPRMENVTAQFWQEIGGELLNVITPFLQRLYLDSAAEFLAGQSIGVDWAIVNQQAVDWASRYSYQLVGGITTNTQAALQSAVSGYYQGGQNMGTLTNSLSGLFGPVRAESIAVTEVTRASAQGELDISNQLMRDNPSLEIVQIWNTNKDDRVCPLCGPLDRKEQGDGWTIPPPIHPRDRCFLTQKIRVRKSA
jgi:hypothetical protein